MTPASDVALVVDQMALRRAQLVQFLERWAASNGLHLSESSISDVARLKQPRTCRIQLLSIGGGEPGDAGVEAAFRVMHAVCPKAPIVIFGEASGIEHVRFAIQIGAAGYIPADLNADIVLAALSFVLKRGTYFPFDTPHALNGRDDRPPPRPTRLGPPAADWAATAPEGSPKEGSRVMQPSHLGNPRWTSTAADPAVELTCRQQEVLLQLGTGRSNKEIARELEMSEATVKVHVRQVIKRLGVANRTQAAVMAVRLPKSGQAPRAALVAGYSTNVRAFRQ